MDENVKTCKFTSNFHWLGHFKAVCLEGLRKRNKVQCNKGEKAASCFAAKEFAGLKGAVANQKNCEEEISGIVYCVIFFVCLCVIKSCS